MVFLPFKSGEDKTLCVRYYIKCNFQSFNLLRLTPTELPSLLLCIKLRSIFSKMYNEVLLVNKVKAIL